MLGIPSRYLSDSNLCNFLRRSEKGFGDAIEKQAKRAAFYIYWNLKPGSARSYIIAEDFEELLPLEQSREAFAMLDQDGNGQLTPKELCAAVTEIYQWVLHSGLCWIIGVKRCM